MLLCLLSFPALSAEKISEPVTYDQIETFLKARPQIRTMEALLEALPASYRSHYTLMYESRSRQGARPDAPRAIFFGSDARLMMAFNGEPDQRNYRTLELIQFDDKTDRFEMHAIVFPKSDDTTTPVHFSEKNPESCLGCHRKDPRPNWESYSLWPGAYGEDDDSVHDAALTGEYEKTRSLEKALKSWIKKATKHPRYKFLENLEDGYSFNKYRTKYEHNIELTGLVNKRNAQRMARLIKETPDYDRFKYLVLYYLGCDWDLPVPWPKGHPYRVALESALNRH